MKKVLLLLLVLIAVTASAQNKKQKSYMPSEGFWVVESSVKTPKQSTIYFYNNAKVLIYKESLTGRRINLGHKRTVQKLNDVLIQSIAAWQKEQMVKSNTKLVRNKF
jgi:cytochrome c553